MRYVIPLVFFFLPLSSNAALLFSEIAWMGTDQSADDEWIELFNHDMSGGGPLDVTGWTLSDGGDINVELEGTIPPMTIVVLERTDDSTVPGVTAFQTYTGSLANTGETLTLRNSEGTVVAEVVGGTDWSSIGGRNTAPKLTPQQGMAGWVTGTPTPGAENVAHDETDTEDVEGEDEEDDNDGEVRGETTTRSGGSANKRTSIVQSTAELTLTVTSPAVAYVNQPVSFTTVATGPGRDIVNSLVYTWNFGDTYTETGKAPVHTYTYPGEYVVVANAKYSKHDVTIQKTIRILPVGVTISRTKDGDVVLTNSASHDIDISGYVLRGTESLTLPPNTFLLKGGSITIARARVIPNGMAMVALYDRERTMIANEMEVRSPLLGTLAQASVPAARTTQAVARGGTNSTKPMARAVSTKDEADTVQGEVAGTSTPLGGLTIPVYAAENETVPPTRNSSNVLPYVGLFLVLLAGILLLFRRGGADGHS